jgi:ribosome-binding factor A
VSALGSDDDKQRAMQGLASARGFLRTQLARALRLRVAPEIHFVLDRGIEHAQRIGEILDRIAEERDAE